jgi:hypothetical protein
VTQAGKRAPRLLAPVLGRRRSICTAINTYNRPNVKPSKEQRGDAANWKATTMTSKTTVEEIDELIRKLAAHRSLADFLGVNSKSADARRLVAYMLAQGMLATRKLPRSKPTRAGWTIAHDVALQAQVLRLQRDENLSERAAIAKISATWSFPHTPRANKHFPKCNSKKQRELALRKRWTDLQARLKLVAEEMTKVGAADFWAQALGVPSGETPCQNPAFQFTRANHYALSSEIKLDMR